jgi:hypothetical protein
MQARILGVALAVAASAAPPAVTDVRAPVVCSRGPRGQWLTSKVTLPRTAEQGTTYTVRIDGVTSGKLAHFGLNHVRDMTTDYALPSGATYVAGSALVVPDTGTPNVAAGARVSYEAGVIRSILTDRVPSGSTFTPPSIEFQVEATAPAGTSLTLELLHYQVMANAILIGDVMTTCEPVPKPFPLGATLVIAPGSLP